MRATRSALSSPASASPPPSPQPPAVDTFTLAGTGPQQGTALQFSVSAQLMQNQLPASPIQPSTNIVVVQDSAGQPMIFAIGTDKAFHVLLFDATQSTGFRLVDLMAGFPGYATAAAFDVTQDQSGRISVVVALAKAGGTATDVFAASLLSDDPTRTDWSKLGSLCVQVTGVDPAFVADAVTLGVSDDGTPAFVVITGAIGAVEHQYQIDAVGLSATDLEFPEDVTAAQVAGISAGYAFGQRGVWFLYATGASQTLECTTLATPGEGSLTYDYSPGAGPVPAALRYNCVTTATGSRTNAFNICSDVYVGTDGGIYVFPNATVGGFQKVTDAIADVHQIIVTQDADNLSIWAICSPDQLYYIAGTKGTTPTFSTPILFSQAVVHVAPIRSAARKANELFVVNQDLSVTHHWQDPTTTLWQERVIRVPASGALVGVNSFTTQIGVRDGQGNPVAGATLQITASEWTYVTINGRVYSLDMDSAAAVPTDLQGNVTIIGLASDISSPIFHLRSDVYAETINVYPNAGIHDGVAAITSGDVLKSVTTPEGPLVDPSTPQTTLDGVAANLSQLTATTGQYFVGVRPPGSTFVAIESAGLRHTGALDVYRLPAGPPLGMRVRGGVWELDPEPHASPAFLAATAGLGGILDAVGDALHWLEEQFVDGIQSIAQGVTVLEDGVSFLIQTVETGLQFVLTIAGKVINVVLKTLGSVFKALNWILKLVGVDLRKILAWLGHLFGWDDIWNTHKVIAAMLHSGLDYAVGFAAGNVDTWRTQIGAQLDAIEASLEALVLPPDLATASPRASGNAATASTPAATSHAPCTSFTSYQIQHGNILASSTTGSAPGAAAARALTMADDPFTRFVTTVVQPTVSALLTDLQADLADVARLCSPSATFTDVLQFVRDVIKTVLDPVRTLLDGCLPFLPQIMGLVRDALTADVDIPLLGDLYAFVTDLLGDEEDFTFINGAALLLAIPFVELTRLVGLGAPLADDSHGLDAPGLFEAIIGPLPRGTARRTTALTAAAPGAQAYSKWGGLVGTAAAVGEALANLINYANTSESAVPVASTSLNTAQKAALAFGLVKTAGTFPVRSPDQSSDASAVKVTSWVLGLAATLVGPFFPRKAQSVLTAASDVVILIFSLVADGLAKEDGLTWTTDILSNLAGITYGIGEAADQAEAVAIGYGVAFITCLIGVIHVVELDEDEVLHIVNIGG